MFLEVGGKVNAGEAARLKDLRLNMSNDEILEAEIEKITDEVDKVLQISKIHTEQVKHELAQDTARHGVSSAPATPPANGVSKENAPVKSEKVKEVVPVIESEVNADTIIDVTLPQNKPGTTTEAKGPPSSF